MLLKQEHVNEWLASGVSLQIVERNVESLDNPDEIDERLNRNSKRRWKHWEYGPGWWVSGVDPECASQWDGRDLNGGEFKPDTPVIKQCGQVQKYFSPMSIDKNEKFSKHPLFLDCADLVQWTWNEVMRTPSIPVGIVEGAKKAGAAMTLYPEMPMISISGVNAGQKKERIHPTLKNFCGIGRKIYLFFDSDAHINKNVSRELERLGRILQAEGCLVYVVEWDTQFKGLDDWITGSSDNQLIAA
jgi:hypothetical protein